MAKPKPEPTYPTTMTRAQWECLVHEHTKRNRVEHFRDLSAYLRSLLEATEGSPVTLELKLSTISHLSNMCATDGLWQLGKAFVWQPGERDAGRR